MKDIKLLVKKAFISVRKGEPVVDACMHISIEYNLSAATTQALIEATTAYAETQRSNYT